ncbi:MAG: histidine--tRNA ligase [Defluviitaleaceae bacterium]|nr:histidine--tRNA ligase [Defluviitaleaceae bacterium]
MSYIKTPTNGMNDYLPEEAKLREYVLRQIKDTYSDFGFMLIETPSVEHIENLTSKQGGENEKLIFKILKRGEKLLNANISEDIDSLVDGGLRYDLTVPLARYYSNNIGKLPTPFKALQIGNVWRADRPQKGRYRQFTQCDIDILGDSSILSEIELVSSTGSILAKLGFSGAVIRINDRRILRAMAQKSGFSEEDFDKVFIILDKLDKIGLDGVKKEFEKSGYDASNIEGYCAWFEKDAKPKTASEFFGNKLEGYLEPEIIKNIDSVLSSVNIVSGGDFSVIFDPTLVRGMAYYTGTIFEASLPGTNLSVGGGGRYDKMIGNFTGNEAPACGFSIGFERIIGLLTENGFVVPESKEKIAFLVDSSIETNKLCEMFEEVKKLRESGINVMITSRNKNAKFQKDVLRKSGYEEFREFF